MIKEYNFDEFDKISKHQWRDKLNQDLGSELAQRISNWSCERELSLSAYYNQEDIGSERNATIGAKSDWKYLQLLKTDSSNKQAIEALMNGAEGLIIDDAQIGNLKELLDQVFPEFCTMALSTCDISRYKIFCNWWTENHPVDGNGEVLLFHQLKEVSSTIGADYVSFLDESFSMGVAAGHRSIHVDCGMIQKSGGSVSLELSYMLSQCVYYINHFLDRGYEIDKIAGSLFISTAIGSSYFLEIAKVRVIRLLLTQLFKQYGLSNVYIPIHATTSSITKSAIDSNTNFLRCTSEAMSAVLGGVDYLSITPHHDLSAADRIARNISNLLKDESYFSKIADPAAGSYYLESLSDKLVESAWNKFQEIELNGGYEDAIKRRFFQQETKKDLDFKNDRISSGRRKMVGVNDFGNQDERISVDQLTHEHFSFSDDFELVRKIVESFVVEKGEAERPVVYLAPAGVSAKMINARYTFVANYFNWAGFEVKKIDASKALRSKHVIVCCGADGDYTDEKLQSILDLESNLVLAAGKEDSGASNKISGWINVKTNRLEMVNHILTQMGITQNSTLS